jgi:hypothetical protein
MNRKLQTEHPGFVEMRPARHEVEIVFLERKLRGFKGLGDQVLTGQAFGDAGNAFQKRPS